MGGSTICPDGTVQRTDCSGSCTWVKVPSQCPKLPDPCTKDPKVCNSLTETCNQDTGKCEPKPDTCTLPTKTCNGNSVVTEQACTTAAGVTTEKTISSVACSSKELCAIKDGTPQCLPDCDKLVSCSPWSEPQPERGL